MAEHLPTSLVGSYAQPDWLIDREKLAARFPPRVRAREPSHWSGLAGLVAHARAMPSVPGADLMLSTEGERAEVVAARIRETARL